MEISTLGLKRPIYVGANGNFSSSSSKYTVRNSSSGDVINMFDSLPIGTVLVGITITAQNLSSSIQGDILLGVRGRAPAPIETSVTISDSSAQHFMYAGLDSAALGGDMSLMFRPSADVTSRGDIWFTIDYMAVGE